MRVNNVNNCSFLGLKGLSQPQNAETFRELSNKYGKEFVKMANSAFQKINDKSGKEDVFIRLETKELDNRQNAFRMDSKTDATIVDSDGKEIISVLLDYPQSTFSLYGLSENLKKLTKGFKENFVSSIPLEEEIDETIEKFA